MIITPQELYNRKSEFIVLDTRLEEEAIQFPMSGIETIGIKDVSIPKMEGTKVLVCQYGILTEGIIIQQELENTFSLLGGAQAWIEFQSKKEDLSQWSRQTILPEVGIEGQKRLLNATVAIVGMGGLGCPAARSLVAAGIGRIKLIDGDIIELSNLHRQPLYGVDDLNRLKVQVAKEKLDLLNKKTVIIPIDKYFNEEDGMSFIQDADLIIDATDNIKSRQLIDKFSKEANIPMIYGGLFRYEGQVAILNVKGSPGYFELFPESESVGDNCADAGILGMVPGIIGNIQALEAVKFIVGIKPNLIGRLLIYDGLSHTTETIKL